MEETTQLMTVDPPTPLVWNPILRQHVINAPHRMSRREGSAQCPFCADLTEGRIGPDVQAWVCPNDFPPLRPPAGEAHLIIYSREHHRTFWEMSIDEVEIVTRLWRDAYRDLATRYP